MGFNTKRQAVLVPAAKVAEFNKIMEHHGYGPAFLVPSEANAVGEPADAKAKPPTHYWCEIGSCDDGLIAAVRKALAKANDKLPDKEKGAESAEFKGPTAKVGKLVNKIVADKGLKKKA